MKSLRKAVFFVSVVVALAGCDKDDPTPSIVGKWTVQSSTLDLQVSGQSLYDFLVSAGIATSQAKAIVDSYADGFNANGVGVIFDFKSDGTYTEQNGPTDTNPSTGLWTQDKTTITLTDNSNPNFNPKGSITSITDTGMTLELKVKSVDGGGFFVDYVVTSNFARNL